MSIFFWENFKRLIFATFLNSTGSRFLSIEPWTFVVCIHKFSGWFIQPALLGNKVAGSQDNYGWLRS